MKKLKVTAKKSSLELQIKKLVDRIVGTDNMNLISAYEKKIYRTGKSKDYIKRKNREF